MIADMHQQAQRLMQTPEFQRECAGRTVDEMFRMAGEAAVRSLALLATVGAMRNAVLPPAASPALPHDASRN